MLKPKLLAFLAILCILAAACSLADTARVVTPGGKLNMRKSPKDRAKLVSYVPNRSLVEVEEVDDEWTKIIFQKKTGYVKTEFLKIASQMPGMTLYGDEGAALLLLEEADAASRIIRPLSPLEALDVNNLENGFAKVTASGDEGYVDASFLSYQHEEPVARLGWISQDALMVNDCDVLASPAASAEIVDRLNAGDAVTVTLFGDGYCLIVSEKCCGYVSQANVSLIGPEDSDDSAGTVEPMAAVETAKKTLAKAYKTFDDAPLYYQLAVLEEDDGLQGPLYHCGFFSDEDQLLYSALVDAQNGQVVFNESYAGFAIPSDTFSLLPDGEVRLTLSTDSLPVGEILDVTVEAWTNHECKYSLKLDGKTIFSGKETDHFIASYRPRQEGDYELTVTVVDKAGQKVQTSEAFTVSGVAEDGPQTVFSQKDGWWLDKPYRKSTLDQSGCAIYALSHALNRMGETGDDIHPSRLAKTFSLCLTADGTNNERLLREASEIYPFTTARDLIENKKKIAQLLQDGCMFSFSVARGHIAMISGISDDGTMVRVVDSAPTVTFERLVNTSIYYQTRSGSWRIASSLDDIEGARWYFETEHYGGLEYWMTIDYAARRGVRLIQPD